MGARPIEGVADGVQREPTNCLIWAHMSLSTDAFLEFLSQSDFREMRGDEWLSVSSLGVRVDVERVWAYYP